MRDEGLDVSLGTIAATIGTVLLVGLAGLGVYIVGAILVYVGIIQPGGPTVFAVAYVTLTAVVPFVIGRSMRRRGSAWRPVIAACAALVVGVSAFFLPFTAAMLM